MNTVPPDLVLVEDNPDEAELTLRTIQKYDGTLSVRVMGDGHEAAQYLTSLQFAPRLVLLNLHLARMSGLEVLEELRLLDAYRFTPVIVMTSDTSPAALQRAYELGANSFIRKPHSADTTVDMLHRLLNYWLNLNEVP